MTLIMVLQLIIAIGLINVWLFRFNKATEYRGGNAKNMKEEFIAYGLPVWLMYFVGAMKVSIALMLVISFWVEELLIYNLLALATLMIAAVLMHVKVKDPLKKSYPALSILFMEVIFRMETKVKTRIRCQKNLLCLIKVRPKMLHLTKETIQWVS